MPNIMRVLLLISAVFFIHTAFSCDTTKFKTFFKIGPGLAYHGGLEEFNDLLSNNAVSKIAPSSFSSLIQGKIQRNNASYQLSFSINNLNNRSSLPQTQVIFNLYHFSLNYGTDLLKSNDQFRLEPFIGLGGTFGDFFVFSSDTLQSTNQVLDGAQNLYYEQPKLALIAESGIRCEYAATGKRMGYFAELNAIVQFNAWNWQIENMVLNKLSVLRFNIGFRFKLF